MKTAIFGPIEVILLLVITVLIVLGVFYVGASGLASIPGIRPFLADTNKSQEPQNLSSPTATPASNPSPTPTEQDPNKQHDDTVKADLTTIDAALATYKKTHKKYPISSSFAAGRTDKTDSPLQVLVQEKLLDKLPTDPSGGDHWYGYRSDGNNFALSAELFNTTDPAGIFNADKKYIYLVTN